MQILKKNQYDALNVIELFSETDHSKSNCYGLITINSHSYKFSWRSNLIEPQILFLKDGIVGIGIDQHFCLLNSQNADNLSLLLLSFFSFMKAFEEQLLVICETEILILDLSSFKLDKGFMFEEIIQDVNVVNHFITVYFIDGTEIIIDLFDKNNDYMIHSINSVITSSR